MCDDADHLLMADDVKQLIETITDQFNVVNKLHEFAPNDSHTHAKNLRAIVRLTIRELQKIVENR